MNSVAEVPDFPSPEEAQQWYVSLSCYSSTVLSLIYARQLVFDHLFQLLTPQFLLLFPSTRVASVAPLEHVHTDAIDQPVWQFLAAVALHAASEQQHILVTALRDKILDNVASVNKGWIRDEEEREMKLANVNLFLHALGLDSSQIVM
jgi:DNA topoisomerase 2-associated protein PAT1